MSLISNNILQADRWKQDSKSVVNRRVEKGSILQEEIHAIWEWKARVVWSKIPLKAIGIVFEQSIDRYGIRILTDTHFVVFTGENLLLALPIERFTLYIWSLTRLEVSHMHFLPLIIALKRYTFGIKQRQGSHHNWIPRYHYCLILADSFLNKSLSCCRLGGKDNSLPICMRRKGFYIQRRPS